MQAVRTTRGAATAVVLVFLFMLINFADKAVIGLASVPIMGQLRLSHAQFGALGSAFFVLFSASGILVGFLANHVRTKTLMLFMALIWAGVMVPMAAVSSFGALIAGRIALGAAEGPAFPVAMHSIYKWFDDQHRALPSSIVASGAAFGAGIVAPLITWIIVSCGWRAAFAALGAVGFTWVLLWAWLAREGPLGSSSETATTPSAPAGVPVRVPYRHLLLSRTAFGVFVAGFAAYWIIALNLVWLANYLIKVLGMPAEHAAWVIALPSFMQMILAPGLALLSQRLSRRGVSSRVSRGLLGSACVTIAGVAMICLAIIPMGALKIITVGLSFSIGSVIFTLGSTLIGEISPPAQRGAMLGISNSIHTVAGVCAPLVMGLIVDINADPIAGFRRGLIDAGMFVAVLGVVAALLINPEDDVRRFNRSIRGLPC